MSISQIPDHHYDYCFQHHLSASHGIQPLKLKDCYIVFIFSFKLVVVLEYGWL